MASFPYLLSLSIFAVPYTLSTAIVSLQCGVQGSGQASNNASWESVRPSLLTPLTSGMFAIKAYISRALQKFASIKCLPNVRGTQRHSFGPTYPLMFAVMSHSLATFPSFLFLRRFALGAPHSGVCKGC